MIKRVRQQVGRWMRRDAGETAPDALLFADHEEIRDISRQIRRTKVEMDRSVLSMSGTPQMKESEEVNGCPPNGCPPTRRPEP